MVSTVIRACFPVAAQVVADKAEEINKLNVFPVPDGDTGTNMSLTLATVVQEIEALPAAASMEDLAHAVTHGSLMGARGNSGVITSQILRGLAEGLCAIKDEDNPSSKDIAYAFDQSVKVAFKAVRKPVEGTILTVLRDVATKAKKLERTTSVHELLEALVIEAYESVARTPELLPVLKENGVVDSGAFGFACFLEGFVNAVTGNTSKVYNFKTTTDAASAKEGVASHLSFEINDDWEGSEFRYCNEFLFHAHSKDFDENAAREFLATMGDCELLVGDNPDYKVHVHSNNPDQVLGYMLKHGQIYNVFIHNMDLEAEERTEKLRADKDAMASDATGSAAALGSSASSGASTTPSELPHKALGVVAVSAGSGQEEILRSLGVDVIVSGGQTMNPSTSDLLSAIEATHADAVVVLPNNSNIRMAAEAAIKNTKISAAVVPTKTVLQAFSALFALDPEASLEENVEAMSEALEDVHDGEVTTAVRNSTSSLGEPICVGDVIGIHDDAIELVGQDVVAVALDLVRAMQAKHQADTLTLLAGKDLSDTDFEKLIEQIETAEPDLEVDGHRGEQPLYPVIFSLE